MSSKSIKCLVVGDMDVGKSSLLYCYANDKPLDKTVPSVNNDIITLSRLVSGHSVSLSLWDSQGEKEYDRLRPLFYPGTDVLLVCFSVANLDSFKTVTSRWNPEISNYAPHSPKILVGTKIDLRDEALKKDIDNTGFVTSTQGSQLAKEIEAVGYFECSALTQMGLNNVFDVAMRTIVSAKHHCRGRRGKSSGKSCVLL